MIALLIIYCFTSWSRIFYLYRGVTIAGEGLQNFGLCSALRAFEQGGIFIVLHLLWHEASVFPDSSEGLPHSVPSHNTQWDVVWRTYAKPNPHWVITMWKWVNYEVNAVPNFKGVMALARVGYRKKNMYRGILWYLQKTAVYITVYYRLNFYHSLL
jgi:hypothetical protein